MQTKDSQQDGYFIYASLAKLPKPIDCETVQEIDEALTHARHILRRYNRVKNPPVFLLSRLNGLKLRRLILWKAEAKERLKQAKTPEITADQIRDKLMDIYRAARDKDVAAHATGLNTFSWYDHAKDQVRDAFYRLNADSMSNLKSTNYDLFYYAIRNF